MARTPTRFWHPARRVVRRVWSGALAIWKNSLRDPAPEQGLDDIRPRLQHYLRAMYGRPVPLEALVPPKNTTWTTRALRNLALVHERGASESDENCIRLPAHLPRDDSNTSALERYRLLAVQHAERMRRVTALHANEATTDLERDLFILAESAAIDAQVSASQPGLRPALSAARASALAKRPKSRWRGEIELRVEAMFRAFHESHVDVVESHSLPTANDAQANATWARRTANALEAEYGRKAARAYRRVPEITLWGTSVTTRNVNEVQVALESEEWPVDLLPPMKPPKAATRSSMPGPSSSSSPQGRSGLAPDDSAHEDASPPTRNKGTKSDGGGADGDPDGDDESDAPESKSPEVDDGDGQDAGATSLPDAANAGTGAQHSDTEVSDDALGDALTYRYPEWDTYAQDFRPAGTVVRVMPPALASSEWPASALRQHGMLVHQAKRQFEKLRSHRLRLRKQVQGDDLDLEACVASMVDRRMGVAPSDRVYTMVRPGRRELAITLLIDVSGSTADPVHETERVIDVERVAALIATAAFDALGDDYSILAFSSSGATNVRVNVVKAFGEKNGPVVMQRIAALAPHGTTRLGAAVRHATVQLRGHPAPHRLLLILSDGKPYDYDWYFVDYAVQDSRRAVMDARAQGIHPFCITVDSADDPQYLADIFGRSGYLMVRRPAELSRALLGAVQRLLA